MTDDDRRGLWGENRLEAGKCGAPRSVAPCAALGVASLDTAAPVQVKEANPVNPLTGQKYQVELDAAPQPGPLGLELKRHYNSALGSVAGPLGRGWSFSYDTRVFTTASTVQIVQADGHRLIFRRPEHEGGSETGAGSKRRKGVASPAGLAGADASAPIVCASDLPENGSVLVLPAGGHEWHWPSGRRLRFDPRGYLVEIREPAGALSVPEVSAQTLISAQVSGPGNPPAVAGVRTGEPAARKTMAQSAPWHVLHIERDPQGRIQRVTDPAGRRMRFTYDHRGHLSAVDHPRGQWRYQVSARGQLLSVTSPTQAQRFYRYEDPGFPSALTAIETGAPMLGQRILQGRWRYDAQGRVIEYRGPAGERRFRYLPVDAKGISTTEVTDAQGRKKTYRFREAFGQWQVLSVTGQDCTHCGPADRYYRYDHKGRLVGLRDQADLDALSLGRLYRVEHDHLGRVIRIFLRTWAATPAEGNSPPSKGDETLTLFRRYEYADESSRLPSLVARPSVEPGKEYTVAYEYRRIAGMDRPVSITERGYSHGAAMTRRARFVYDDDGRLSQMDGPLPGDADRIDFREARDEDGRLRVRLMTAWGEPVDPSVDNGWLRSSLDWLMDNGRFHAEAGALRHVAPNGAAQRVRFDDFGRITQIESPDAGVETTYHDVADRVIRQTDSSGAELRFEYDDRDRPVLKTLIAPDGKAEQTRYRYQGRHLVEVSSPVSTERYEYDDQGRVLSREASVHPTTSAPVQRFVTRYAYEDSQHWPTRITLPNGAVIDRTLSDNWHRVRLFNQTDDEAPVELYRRQVKPVEVAEGGRQEIWQFGNGLQRELVWGEDGRLVMLRDGQRDDASGKFGEVLTEQVLSYRPDGQIAATGTPEQIQRFAYNRAGQLIIAQASSGTAWWYAYDDNGNRIFSGRHLAPGNTVAREKVAAAKVPRERADHPDRVTTARAAGSGARRVDDLMPDEQAGTIKVSGGRDAGRQAEPSVHASSIRVSGVESMTHLRSAGAGAGADADAEERLADDEGSVLRENAEKVLKGTNRYEGVPYDAVGRPLTWQGWQIRWHAGGQIESMTDGKGRQIDYFYNHRGERVARLEDGQWRFYDYLDGRLLAERRLDDGPAAQSGAEGAHMRVWWHEGSIPVVMLTGERQQPEQRGGLAGWLRRLWAAGSGRHFEVSWLHVDHHALPLAVTDERGTLRWQQHFGPFGEPETGHARAANEGQLTRQKRNDAHDPMLRFPGQWVDESTGLYYNMMRDYDPWMGRYLSPDPLGLRAGPNPYLYVNGDPIRNIDPTGLLLFAFDGTLNAPNHPTNVWFFSQLYQHQGNGPNPLGSGHRPYLSGIGIVGGPHLPYGATQGDYLESMHEVYYAHYWRDNVEFHVQQFRDAVLKLKDGEQLDVDVVGFSRGASQATEFGRLIARELRSGRFGEKASQVNLRFMGLMDPVPTNLYSSHEGARNFGRNETVPSYVSGTGFSGRGAVADWENQCQPMMVDDEWDSVVNILATHDRRNTLFKAATLGSQVGKSRTGMLREEFAMVGAHSDIGGGYDDGDLSNVALWALVERARAAGVQLAELPENLSRVDRPIVHIEQWGMDLKERDREFLVDGVWKRQGDSGVRGIAVSREEVGWQDTERNEIVTGIGKLWRDDVVASQQKLNGLLTRESRAGRRTPDEAGARGGDSDQAEGDARPRSGLSMYFQDLGRDADIIWKAAHFKTTGTARIDMSKYCAYLLREAILQTCPY
ncbi:MAG: RHS repeat-associated core domain-containing protein [Lautropia sp.]|nr:RHS repeat-associated core domain-containing protein [Lautropia sp.]